MLLADDILYPLKSARHFKSVNATQIPQNSIQVANEAEGLMVFLKYAFRESPLLPAVSKESIWLFTPSAAQEKTWHLIDEEDWDIVARPGMQLGMSLVGNQHHG